MAAPVDRTLRIRLEAPGAALEVAPAIGGRIAGLEVDGWDVIRRDGWTDREWGSFVMAPWIGRLRNGRVRWRGAAWDMPLTEPPHAIHGTVLDVPWTVAGVTATSATLEAGLGPDWPFEGRVVRVIELQRDGLVDRLEVHAQDEPFPAVIGWHPWFRRRAVRLADRAESAPAELAIGAASRVDLDLEGLPTGWLAEPRPIPQDDVLLEVPEPPVVSWAGGPALTLRCDDAVAWVAYAAHPDGVCVEPVTGLPDGLNRSRLGVPPVAEPGRPLVATLELRW
jgi:galactose mutarotase-like enzyme